MGAPKPAGDAARIAALNSYAVLDTTAEPAFDRIAALAARTLDMPIALVSLVDAERQWFKACIGLSARETHRDRAFCAHAILSSDLLIVPDATLDPRFAERRMMSESPDWAAVDSLARAILDGVELVHVEVPGAVDSVVSVEVWQDIRVPVRVDRGSAVAPCAAAHPAITG